MQILFSNNSSPLTIALLLQTSFTSSQSKDACSNAGCDSETRQLSGGIQSSYILVFDKAKYADKLIPAVS